MVDESILARIRKLLNVTSERGATAGEAENAAAAVRALLTRHNLSLLDLPPEEQPSEEVEEHEVNLGVRRLPEWLNVLASGVARGFDCRFIHHRYVRGTPRWVRKTVPERYGIVGAEVDAHVAEALLRSLRRELTRDADQAADRLRLKGTPRRRYRQSFLVGAAEVIWDRLQEERRAERRQSHRANEIVVRKQDAVMRKLAEMGIVRSEAPEVQHDRVGRLDGQRRGDRIHLGTDGLGVDRRETLALPGPGR